MGKLQRGNDIWRIKTRESWRANHNHCTKILMYFFIFAKVSVYSVNSVFNMYGFLHNDGNHTLRIMFEKSGSVHLISNRIKKNQIPPNNLLHFKSQTLESANTVLTILLYIRATCKV